MKGTVLLPAPQNLAALNRMIQRRRVLNRPTLVLSIELKIVASPIPSTIGMRESVPTTSATERPRLPLGTAHSEVKVDSGNSLMSVLRRHHLKNIFGESCDHPR